jgi:hypothetical protein
MKICAFKIFTTAFARTARIDGAATYERWVRVFTYPKRVIGRTAEFVSLYALVRCIEACWPEDVERAAILRTRIDLATAKKSDSGSRVAGIELAAKWT